MLRTTLFITLFVSCCCFPWDITPIIQENKQHIVSIEKLIRYHYENNEKPLVDDYFTAQKTSNLTLLGFSWSNCGNPDDDIQLKTLTVLPDPIVVPGTAKVSLDATINTTIETATSIALVVKKKLFGVFVEVPCVDNFGSCTYNDPCALLSRVTCPPELVKLGWTCRCPIPAKHYVVPETDFKIPQLPIPSSLENGDYQIQATLMNGSTRLACYNVTASLEGPPGN